MGRKTTYTKIEDERVLNNIRIAKNKAIHSIKKLMQTTDNSSMLNGLQACINLISVINFQEGSSTSGNNGFYEESQYRIVLSQRGMAFNDKRQGELILHELAHLVCGILFPNAKRHHGKEFVNCCKIIDSEDVARAKVRSVAEDFYDPSYYAKDKAIRQSRERETGSREYKYKVVCIKCGAFKRYKNRMSIFDRLDKCTCARCGGKLELGRL